jgi:hypothetical protein
MITKKGELLKQLISSLPDGSEITAAFENFPVSEGKGKKSVDGNAVIRIKKFDHDESQDKSRCKLKLSRNNRMLLELKVCPLKKEIVVERADILWLLSQISLIRALLRARISLKKRKENSFRIRISRRIFTSVFSSTHSENHNQ